MSEQYTPGPWGIERCEVTPCFHIEAGAYPFGTSICEVNDSPRDGSAEANARLIAAAPELLAALKAMLGVGPPSIETDMAEMEKACFMALAAIARAEGTAP